MFIQFSLEHSQKTIIERPKRLHVIMQYLYNLFDSSRRRRKFRRSILFFRLETELRHQLGHSFHSNNHGWPLIFRNATRTMSAVPRNDVQQRCGKFHYQPSSFNKQRIFQKKKIKNSKNSPRTRSCISLWHTHRNDNRKQEYRWPKNCRSHFGAHIWPTLNCLSPSALFVGRHWTHFAV